jgi:uncharacterized iron-regulated membrane protein
MKLRLRPWVGKIHLILGLITGLVFSLVCFSGALIAFTEEALNIVNRHHLRVPIQQVNHVAVDQVLADYKLTYPRERVLVFNTYRDPARSYDFFSAELKPGTDDQFSGYKMVYANPYTGEILHVDHGTLQIIVTVVTLHTTLLMGKFGHGLIRWCTWLFFFQLLAGLILWWPPTRKALANALTWNWRDGRRRFVFDGHRVTGFYAATGLLAMVGTALFMSWGFVAKPVVAVAGGDPSLVHNSDVEHVFRRRGDGPEYSIDKLIQQTFLTDSAFNQVTVAMPFHDTIGTYTVRTHLGETFLNFEVGNPIEYDRVTGKAQVGLEAKAEAKNAEIYATNLLIHMGFWGGSITKMLYFVIGMAGATLPITGFLHWWAKRKRRTKFATL